MSSPYRVVACDFDGVIANSMPIIEASWRAAIATVIGDAGQDTEAVIHNLYQGAGAAAAVAGTSWGPELGDAVRLEKNRDWIDRCDDVPVFPDVLEVLPGLAEVFTMAVASSGVRSYLDHILQREGIHHYFSHIIGQDNITRLKPDPQILHVVAEKAGVELSEICMVGDTTADYLTSQRAGCDFILMQADGGQRTGLQGHTGPVARNWHELRDHLTG